MAQSYPPLTPGACAILMDPSTELSGYSVVLQFLSVKKLPASPPTGQVDRYRIIVSDGTHFLQAMLATQLNHLVENNTLARHVVVNVTKLANNIVQNKRLVIILDVDESSIFFNEERIGSPTSLEARAEPIADPIPTEAPPPQRQQPQQRPHAPPVPSNNNNANRGGAFGGEKPPPIYPIEGLSPYQNKWTIKARVLQKSDIKTWSNPRGEGKLFSCTLMDETGEIKATAFNAACDEHFDRLVDGKVYFISRARVNVAKKKFNNIANEYEITLEKSSEIRECTDPNSVPEVKYNFVPLSQMETLQKDATCDILAVVHEVGETGELVSKTTNKPFTKRELTLVDQSEMSIRFTLWGKQAQDWKDLDHPVIAIKGAKVSDFGGRSLSANSGCTITNGPDMPDAHTLRGWYDSEASSLTFRSQSGGGGGTGGPSVFNRNETKTINVVQETVLGLGDKPDYFNTRATIIHMKAENMWYTSCPGEGCQKKVTETGDGEWRCEKCDRTYDRCEYRYLSSISVADHTGQLWLQGFNDIGQALIGMSAAELHDLQENDQDKFTEAVGNALGKIWNLSCRAKQETYQEQTRVRYGISRVHQVNFKEESLALLENIRKYSVV